MVKENIIKYYFMSMTEQTEMETLSWQLRAAQRSVDHVTENELIEAIELGVQAEAVLDQGNLSEVEQLPFVDMVSEATHSQAALCKKVQPALIPEVLQLMVTTEGRQLEWCEGATLSHLVRLALHELPFVIDEISHNEGLEDPSQLVRGVIGNLYVRMVEVVEPEPSEGSVVDQDIVDEMNWIKLTVASRRRALRSLREQSDYGPEKMQDVMGAINDARWAKHYLHVAANSLSGEHVRLLRQLAVIGSQQEQKLTELFQPTIQATAKKLSCGHTNMLKDLVAEGNLGLLDALDRYDPARGALFSTYALTRIRGSMVDFLRSHGTSSIRVHRSAFKLRNKIHYLRDAGHSEAEIRTMLDINDDTVNQNGARIGLPRLFLSMHPTTVEITLFHSVIFCQSLRQLKATSIKR